MEQFEASTLVHLPAEEVYDAMYEYTGYPEHVPYLEDVVLSGRERGTRISLELSWWRIAYRLRGRVTDCEPDRRIEWRLTRDIDGHGHWAIEPAPDEAPEGGSASTLRLSVTFDPESLKSALRLPGFVSLSWVMGRMERRIASDGGDILEDILADVEGNRRPVEYEVHAKPEY